LVINYLILICVWFLFGIIWLHSFCPITISISCLPLLPLVIVMFYVWASHRIRTQLRLNVIGVRMNTHWQLFINLFLPLHLNLLILENLKFKSKILNDLVLDHTILLDYSFFYSMWCCHIFYSLKALIQLFLECLHLFFHLSIFFVHFFLCLACNFI